MSVAEIASRAPLDPDRVQEILDERSPMTMRELHRLATRGLGVTPGMLLCSVDEVIRELRRNRFSWVDENLLPSENASSRNFDALLASCPANHVASVLKAIADARGMSEADLVKLKPLTKRIVERTLSGNEVRRDDLVRWEMALGMHSVEFLLPPASAAVVVSEERIDAAQGKRRRKARTGLAEDLPPAPPGSE
ncbi:MAG: hypothetical protein AAGA65_23900 [Actinomycetota bacterium]